MVVATQHCPTTRAAVDRPEYQGWQLANTYRMED
jgi:hypothetical protein